MSSAEGRESFITRGNVLRNPDGADIPAEYLGFFATEIAKSERSVALLALSDGGHLLLAQHPSSGKDMNALLKTIFEKFGGKGGGARDFARGRVNDPSQAANALALAKELLSAG